MSTENNVTDVPVVPPADMPFGPKHLNVDTIARLLDFERYLIRHLPSHHVKAAQVMLRSLLRMVECDAQLAQLEKDFKYMRTMMGSDNGSAQSVPALNLNALKNGLEE